MIFTVHKRLHDKRNPEQTCKVLKFKVPSDNLNAV